MVFFFFFLVMKVLIFCIGFGWYNVLIVVIFLMFFGFNFCKMFWILVDLNWNIFEVLFCWNKGSVFVLFNGIFFNWIFCFFICLIVFKVKLIIDKLCSFRKFIFKRLMVFILFIVYWVRKVLLELCWSGINLSRFLLLIIIFVVWVEMCFGNFFKIIVVLNKSWFFLFVWINFISWCDVL